MLLCTVSMLKGCLILEVEALNYGPVLCFAEVTLLREERPKVIMEDDERDGDKMAI